MTYKLRGEGIPLPIIISLICVALLMLQMGLYFYFFRLGRAPALLFYPDNTHYVILAIGMSAFVMSLYDIKLLRIPIYVAFVIIYVNAARNLYISVVNKYEINAILFSLFMILTIPVLYSFLTKKNIKQYLLIEKLNTITTSILSCFSCIVAVMMTSYNLSLSFYAFTFSVAIVLVAMFLPLMSSASIYAIKCAAKAILVACFARWGAALLDYDHAGINPFIFLSVAVIGTVSIALDILAYLASRKEAATRV